MTGMVTFPVDGRQVPGYLALPETGKGPGVLVLHAWWGLNDFFKTFCNRLAQAGFVAFAPDLYHGKQVATTIPEADKLRLTLNKDETYQDVTTAVHYLLEQPQTDGNTIGAIGFSLGGSWALSLKEHISAIVTFYGIAEPEEITANAAFLGNFAEHDDFESDGAYDAEFLAAVERLAAKLREQGKEVTFTVYPTTKHWFFEEDRPEYDAEAARLAWERTVAFLNQHLKR